MIIGYWSPGINLAIVNFITSKHCDNRILSLESTLKTSGNSLAAKRQRSLSAEETDFGSESRV